MAVKWKALLVAVTLAWGAWAYLRWALHSGPEPRPRPSLWPLVYVTVVGAAVASFVLGFSFHSSVRWLARENGEIEWTSFWLGAIGAVVFGAVAWRSRRGPLNVLALAIAGLCFFIAGEEIAWGQHWFHFNPPEAIATRNYQGEMTLHNLKLEVGGVSIGIWLQSLAPLAIVLAVLACQILKPNLARRHTGVKLHPNAVIVSIFFALFVLVSSWPHVARVEADVPLSQLPAEIFRRHSYSQSEISELMFAGLLLVGGLAMSLQSSSDEPVRPGR